MTNLAQVSSGGMTHSTRFPAGTGAPTPRWGLVGVGGALLALTTRLRLQKGRVEHVGGADAEPGQSPGGPGRGGAGKQEAGRAQEMRLPNEAGEHAHMGGLVFLPVFWAPGLQSPATKDCAYPTD